MGHVETAIERIRQFAPVDAYWGAFSGGKDSCAIKELGRLAGVKIEWHFSVCTIEPPELVRFIRQHHPDVLWDRPKIPMLRRMLSKGPPFRSCHGKPQRWCCGEYKEHGGEGRIVLLGLRWDESHARSKRKMVETCTKTGKGMVSPIIDWTTEQVWDFIRDRKLPYCKLYDEGFTRIGCVFCPMAYWKRRVAEAERWPLWRAAFIAAFERLRLKRLAGGKSEYWKKWASGEEFFEFWIRGKGLRDKVQK
jgi:phosphoadenosine phosphosulfate reductase